MRKKGFTFLLFLKKNFPSIVLIFSSSVDYLRCSWVAIRPKIWPKKIWRIPTCLIHPLGENISYSIVVEIRYARSKGQKTLYTFLFRIKPFGNYINCPNALNVQRMCSWNNPYNGNHPSTHPPLYFSREQKSIISIHNIKTFNSFNMFYCF